MAKMVNKIIRWLSVLLFVPLAHAQSTPAPYAAYLGAGSPVTWSPWTSAAAFGAISITPPAIGLYCQASAGAAWTPCNPSSGSAGVVSINTVAGAFSFTGAGVSCVSTTCTFSGTGSGVGSITGDGTLINNVASSGVVTLTLGTAGAHKYFGNNTGSTAAPGYDSLVAADIPTGIPIANIGSAGLSGTSPIAISSAGVISCSTCATSGFANPMTTLGDVIYGGASGAATRLAGPTSGAGTYFLIDVPTTTSAVAETFSTAATGTGAPVLSTSPTLVTPALGTPSAAVLTNATGLPAASVLAGALANGMTATTQTTGDNTTKVATDAFVIANAIFSPAVYIVSQQCAGSTTDLTIGLQANGSASTDISTCLAGLVANASPTQPVDIVIDHGYKGAVHIPVGGNVTIEGLGGGISNTPITACSVTSNVATLTAKNTLAVGTNVLFSGMTTCTALNVASGGVTPYFTVLSAGLSSTQFEVNVTTANVSGSEAGYASNIQGTGLFAPNGLNNDVINVAPNGTLIPSAQTGTPPQRGSNVTIKNLVLNGNRRDGTNGNSTTGDARGNNSVSWYYDIHIWSMENVLIDRVVAYNAPAYALGCDNCGHVRITNSDAVPFLVGQTVIETNQDGWHIDGPSNDIFMSNDYMRTGDDTVALNAWEGWCGPITNVVATNMTLHQAIDGGRAYTTSATCTTGSGLTPIVSHVSYSNWQGDVQNSPYIFGIENSHAMTVANSITDFTWTNSTIASSMGFWLADSIGNLTFDNVNLRSISNASGQAVGFVNPVFTAMTANSITLNNDTITRTSAGSTGVGAVYGASTSTYAGSGTFARVNTPGFKVVDEGGSYSASSGLFVLNGGTASTITLANPVGYDSTNISAVQVGGTISGFAGGFVVPTTLTVGTGSISANSCNTVTTVTMLGVTTAMTPKIAPTSDVSAVTGWGPSSSGQLYFVAWPSAANTVKYYVCNPTSSGLAPVSSTTWNLTAGLQ